MLEIRKRILLKKPSRTASLNICGLGDKISELISFMIHGEDQHRYFRHGRHKETSKNMQEVFKKYVLMEGSRSERMRKTLCRFFLSFGAKYVSERVI